MSSSPLTTRALDLLRRSEVVLRDLLFPEYCVGCTERGELFCAECLDRSALCGEHLTPNIHSLFEYQDRRIKAAIRLLKYRNSRPLADVFGKALAGHLLELLAEEDLFAGESISSPLVRGGLGWWGNLGGKKSQRQLISKKTKDPWVLIPTPLSTVRFRERGYNQAELISRSLISHLPPGLIVLETQALAKIKDTDSQVSIKDRESRLANQRGAFAVPYPELVFYKRCIVLDDVVTTGATMREAMRVLRLAGAKKVLGLSLAH